MPIISLRISDFRNIAQAELALVSGINLICGNNGSGKTSLLEAIHFLSLGRSFRQSSFSQLIRYSKDKFSIFAQLINEDRVIPVGVERDLQGEAKLRMAEKDLATVTELAYFLPVRVINSHAHHLFEAGPIFRRKFLDWGLFYQSEGFLHVWRQFERALKQRNAALKEGAPKTLLSAWTEELAKYGLILDGLRKEYTNLLIPKLISVVTELINLSGLKASYESGFGKQDFHSVLSDSYRDDIRLGYTQYGPHRADLNVTVEGISVKHFLSRGQQKLLICAMIFAQGMLLAEQANKGLIYLVDDLPSELDLPGRQRLISLLSEQKTQVFITAIESATICDLIKGKSEAPIKMFHVKHGSVVEA